MKKGLILCAALALIFFSCSKKKEEAPRTIKAKVEVQQARSDTLALDNTDEKERFAWGDSYYEARLIRTADKSAALVEDAEGTKYYDNAIRLILTGSAGKVLDRVFHKSDFASFISSSYLSLSHCALVSIYFREVEDNLAVFIATVGSPDYMDDEFILVELKVDKQGGVALQKIEELEDLG